MNKKLLIDGDKILWGLGLLIILIGATLMWNGHILGEDYASIGRTLGIIGIVAIGAAASRLRRIGK